MSFYLGKMKSIRFGLNQVYPVLQGNGDTTNLNKTAFNKSSIKIKIPRSIWFLSDIECLKRATRSNFLYNGSFQEATGSVLALAQLFSIMPVVGVKSGSASKLSFEWKCFRTIYALIMFALIIGYAALGVNFMYQQKMDFDAIIPVVFYTCVVYGLFCFLIIARKWPSLMQQWELVESKLPHWRTQYEKRQLAIHIKMVAIVVLLCSLVEHVLNTVSIVHYSVHCMNDTNPIESLFKAQLSQLFAVTTFSPWKAFIGKYINIVATFFWSYTDLFVMMISLGLSSGFKHINAELRRINGKHMNEEYWSVRRNQYRKMADLCRDIDQAISHVTLLSLSNNLFFICVQLTRSLRPMPSLVHAVYFWFSLIFLITRTLAVSLYSAEIHEESKKPIEILRSVPHGSWYIQVQRFAEEVVHGMVALTGMQFFYLTRPLILNVAGTIVTYELVLYQFYAADEGKTNLCAKQ